MDQTEDFFSSEGFMPHGHCYLWTPELLWLNIVSDAVIALAYLSIPVTLIYFMRKRKELPFNWIFGAFGAFILACGATHVMDIWTIWNPSYWLSGFVKAIAAAASIVTAVLLVKLIPAALRIPSQQQLTDLNSELIAANAELQQANARLAEINNAKGDFLTNMSHELRTPLTLILAPLEQLLAAGHAPADWRTQLERAQRNTLLLMNRVNDILDFTKAEAGKFDLRAESVDLNKAVGELADDAALVARAKGCVLTWRIDPALGMVSVDPRHFEKIVLNLVSNAIKFTPPGGSIHLAAAPLDGERFEFSVQNSGIGIAPDKQSLLFQRFSQIDNSATRQHSGTGIGLALVKELAELMGGEVGVDSEAGQGARFFVRLPQGAEQHATVPTQAGTGAGRPRSASESEQRRLRFLGGSHDSQAAPDAESEPLAEAGMRSRVLLVDDNPDMLSYLSELLRGEYLVATATDGEQAWVHLQQRPVDLVVSDVMMPALDGFGLTARIKASAGFSHLPIILLTASGGSEASASGLDIGADDYIAKPFSPLELKARVRAALRMGQVQAELRERFRQSGMAEIATNVLHNVGNVLNSVNISADLISSRVHSSKAAGLTRAVQMINEHAAELGDFLTHDEKGKRLPEYLNKLAEALSAEQQSIIDELGQLAKSIEHIKDIVATQQSYAGACRVVAPVQIEDLMEDALRMNAAALTRHEVTVVREFAKVPLLPLDRHRVLQILVNLISNAKQAMDGVVGRSHRLTLRIEFIDSADSTGGRHLKIGVADEGEGIAAENLPRIFTHGFTTRRNGHGFGLHSCALTAREMGGTLTAHSAGPGLGALFTLELPIRAAEGTA